MKVDVQKLHDAMAQAFKFQASRVRTFNRDVEQPADTDGSPLDPGIVAGAIAMSLLMHMRTYAEIKPLHAKDVQVAIDAFFDNSGLEEYETPMGAVMYRWRD